MPSSTFNPQAAPTVTSPEVVDLQFALHGRAIPEDYADALWGALSAALPWLAEEARAGIHPVYGLSPGSGEWYLSRRSRLVMRLPRQRAEAAQALVGAHLSLGGLTVEVGGAAVKELTELPVIYAKFVALTPPDPTGAPIGEAAFLTACQAQFAALGILPKFICGKAQRTATPAGLLSGFSLLLTGLDAAANLRLQQEGLGIERKRGCGIFIPHKSFAAVATLE